MELFRKAAVWQADTSSPDWTRNYGYADSSEFPFPDLYLDPKVDHALERFNEIIVDAEEGDY